MAFTARIGLAAKLAEALRLILTSPIATPPRQKKETLPHMSPWKEVRPGEDGDGLVGPQALARVVTPLR